jgi:hypothetical protein
MGLTITIDSRASLNVDFVLSLFLLLVVVGGILGTVQIRLETVEKSDEAVQARLISEKVASAIEEVYAAGEGHEIRIEMPGNIEGSPYQVKVNQSGVRIDVGGWTGYSYSFSKKISDYAQNQNEVIMRPNTNYTLRNVKEGKRNIVVIF